MTGKPNRKRGGARVSVFGKNSVNLSYGNSGSSGGDLTGAIGLHEGLERAGFTVNPTLKEFYEDDSRSGAKRAPNSDDLDSGDNNITDGDKYTAGMYYFVEYEESIYSGYRYYETRASGSFYAPRRSCVRSLIRRKYRYILY